jgi:hypothetical protein
MLVGFLKAENKVYDFLESLNIKKSFVELMTGAMLEDTKFKKQRLLTLLR